MANIFQTTFSYVLFWKKFFGWNFIKVFFLGVQLANSQNWCWTGATSHHLSQWWPSPLVHIWITRPWWNAFYVHVGLRKMLLQNKLEIWNLWGWQPMWSHWMCRVILTSDWFILRNNWDRYVPWNISEICWIFLVATKQVYEWFSQSVCLSHPFHFVPITISSWNYHWWKWCQGRSEVKGHRLKSNLAVSGL